MDAITFDAIEINHEKDKVKTEFLRKHPEKEWDTIKTGCLWSEGYVRRKLNDLLGLSLERISGEPGSMDLIDTVKKIRVEVKCKYNDKKTVYDEKFIRDIRLNHGIKDTNMYIYINIDPNADGVTHQNGYAAFIFAKTCHNSFMRDLKNTINMMTLESSWKRNDNIKNTSRDLKNAFIDFNPTASIKDQLMKTRDLLSEVIKQMDHDELEDSKIILNSAVDKSLIQQKHQNIDVNIDARTTLQTLLDQVDYTQAQKFIGKIDDVDQYEPVDMDLEISKQIKDDLETFFLDNIENIYNEKVQRSDVRAQLNYHNNSRSEEDRILTAFLDLYATGTSSSKRITTKEAREAGTVRRLKFIKYVKKQLAPFIKSSSNEIKLTHIQPYEKFIMPSELKPIKYNNITGSSLTKETNRLGYLQVLELFNSFSLNNSGKILTKGNEKKVNNSTGNSTVLIPDWNYKVNIYSLYLETLEPEFCQLNNAINKILENNNIEILPWIREEHISEDLEVIIDNALYDNIKFKDVEFYSYTSSCCSNLFTTLQKLTHTRNDCRLPNDILKHRAEIKIWLDPLIPEITKNHLNLNEENKNCLNAFV